MIRSCDLGCSSRLQKCLRSSAIRYSSLTIEPASTSPPQTTSAIRLAMWKSCALMKPPSRRPTSWALMVAMPERPATGNKPFSGARQLLAAIALACAMAMNSNSSLCATTTSSVSR